MCRFEVNKVGSLTRVLVSVPFTKGMVEYFQSAYPHIWEIMVIDKAIDKGFRAQSRLTGFVDDRIGRGDTGPAASRKIIIAMLFSFCSRSYCNRHTWDS
jgi:hypothetical protein